MVDARGMRCPMPLVMTKLKMEELAEGEELTVLATDPEASIDISAWAADEGHGFREQTGDGYSELVLRRGAAGKRARAC